MKPRSLLLKINIAILTTATAVSLVFGLILYPLEIRRQADQVKRIHLLLETVFKQKRNDLANELFARQERALKASLDEIVAVDGIVGVNVFDKSGKLFLSSNDRYQRVVPKEAIEQAPTKTLFEKANLDDHPVGIYASVIEVIGKKIGYIVIFYDFSKIARDSQITVFILIGLVVATALLMALLMNLFLYRSVIQPVSLLRNAMSLVGKGLLGERVHLPIKDEIGEMGSAFNDMSIKLRDGREALIKAEEKYRGIFENAIEGIFQCTPGRGRFITVSPSTAALLGYDSPEEVMDAIDDIGAQLFAHPQDWRQFEESLRQKDRVVGFEAELTTKAGDWIWTSVSARRVSEKVKQITYYEGSFLNITERKQREKAERAREAAEAASKAKSEFLAVMSHEVRTPLNIILGFADILASKISDEQQRNYISNIKSSGSNLLQLINDILDLSKIEAGRMEIQYSAVDLRRLTGELQNLFSVIARQKNLDLRVDIVPEVPLYLMLDRARLRQVLFNLIGNAVKFTDAGAVEILVKTMQCNGHEQLELHIEVRDTGPGIEPETQNSIFEPFSRKPGDGCTVHEGTGLGLSISKRLVEMMGGRILMESHVGQGSTFIVTLPGVNRAQEGLTENESLPGPVDSTGGMVFEVACVLIVDDLAVNRELLLEALRNQPYLKILEADNGRSAVSMALQNHPDLIMMDIRMPGIDGYETAAEIRRCDAIADVPIIAITAAGMREDIEKIASSGFDAYLIRPYSKVALFDRLARFLGVNPESDSAAVVADEDRGMVLKTVLSASWECPPGVGRLLHQKYLPAWEEIKKKRRIPDIKVFSENIRELGEQHGIGALSVYGQALWAYADSIDIARIHKTLTAFPALLDGAIPLPTTDRACTQHPKGE